MICYTIGHSTRKLEDFLSIIKNYGIDCVMDVRSEPHSSNIYNKSYDKELLEVSVKQSGINYIYMGDTLGVKVAHDGNSKDKGEMNLRKIVDNLSYKKGLNKIVEGIKRGHKIVLMCSERNPLNCHRSIILGASLTETGVTMEHIIDEDKTKSQKRIEEEIFITYEPILKEKFLNVTIQDVLDKDDYDHISLKDIKKDIIREGYIRKFDEICKKNS